MLTYLLVFFISFVFLYVGERLPQEKKSIIIKYSFYTISIGILTILAAFRDLTIGRDIPNYVTPTFNTLNRTIKLAKYLNYTGNVEKLYALLNYISYKLSPNINFFLGLHQTLILIIILKACSLYSHILKQGIAIIFLFYLLFYYNLSLSMMRQIIAIALSFWAFYYITVRNWKKYYILSFIAIGFHNSAIITLIFYPMSIYFEKSISFFLIKIMLLGVFLYFTFSMLFPLLTASGLLTEKYEMYQNDENASLQKMQLLIYVLLFLFVLICSWYHKPVNKYVVHLEKMVMSFLVFAIIFTLLGTKVGVADRLSYYFITPLLALIPIYLFLIKIPRNYFLLFISLSLLINFLYMSNRTKLADTIPYSSKILGI